jgi:hypothetical protein
LKQLGYAVKFGKHYAVKMPGNGKFLRLNSLGEGYTQEHITERLRGARDNPKRGASGSGAERRNQAEIDSEAERKAAAYMESLNQKNAPNLLIDIQAKMAEGKGEGYKHWAHLYNLKSMSKTLLFLNDNDIKDIVGLKEKAHSFVLRLQGSERKTRRAIHRAGEREDDSGRATRVAASDDFTGLWSEIISCAPSALCRKIFFSAGIE